MKGFRQLERRKTQITIGTTEVFRRNLQTEQIPHGDGLIDLPSDARACERTATQNWRIAHIAFR